MRINGFLVAALVSVTMLSPARALTIGAGAPTASIFGHDAFSRFTPNGYTVDMDRPDDGTAARREGSTPSGAGDRPAALPDPSAAPQGNVTQMPSQVPAGLEQDLDSLLRRATPDQAPQLLSIPESGGPGPQGSTIVGTVPLPPALPLFGAALLLVAALGRGLRRQVSKPAA